MKLRKAVVKELIDAAREELESYEIYRQLASMFSGSTAAKLLRIARMEKRHAEVLLSVLRKLGVEVAVHPRWLRTRFLTMILRLFGPGLAIRVLEAGEKKAIELYAEVLEGSTLSEEDREALRQVLEDELIHEQILADEGSRFREFLDNIRDALLGMNDGLVEVLSVSAGLAGVYGNPLYVALGGFIVGISGALSMGIGMWASTRAERQVHLSVIKRVWLAARYAPRILIDRLRTLFTKRGIDPELSSRLLDFVSKDRQTLARMYLEEEHGIHEETLASPTKAGLYTGIFYMVGAFVPLIPYALLLPTYLCIFISFALAAVLLAMVGFVIAISAELSIGKKMLELILTGLGSATLTFLVGRLASLLLGIEIG